VVCVSVLDVVKEDVVGIWVLSRLKGGWFIYGLEETCVRRLEGASKVDGNSGWEKSEFLGA
jgi:hypothetical protein